MRPTLLNSCARAATAEEARYRIDGPQSPPRVALVVALDRDAERVVQMTAAFPWKGAHFYVNPTFSEGSAPASADTASPSNGHHNGAPSKRTLLLEEIGHATTRLDEALAGADLAVLVATAGEGSEVAAAIGAACSAQGVMTTGLLLGKPDPTTTNTLRPHARVLLISSEESDLGDLLTAFRA